MVPIRWMIPTCVAFLTTLGSEASADGMRCGRRLVSSGDTTYEVRSRCGEPQSAQQRTELRQVERRVSVPCRGEGRCVRKETVTVEVVIDEWVYDLSPRRFVRYLTFENGRLVGVTTGTYGRRS